MKKLFVLAMIAIMTFVACNNDENNDTPDGKVSIEGRWNAPRFAERPDDYAFVLVFKGSALDLYIIAWGQHYLGTYTLADGRVNYTITDVYQAYSDVTYNEDGSMASWSWWAGNLNQDTFKLEEGFDWYLMNDNPDYASYIEELSNFKFEIDENGTAHSDIFGIEDIVFTKAK